VDIHDNGSVDGNIVSPRVAVAEGSHFRGSVDMQQKPAVTPAQAARSDVKPVPPSAAPQGAGGQRLVGA
jgi:cytoskeletal protein CcmA (bactofilin family)